MKILAAIISLLILQTCQNTDTSTNEMTLWVHSAKKDCSGVGKMTCLQIQKSETLNLNENWELFYAPIEGFEYRPGYLYKLKVSTAEIENPPADASSIKYTLIEVLEKKQDLRYAIHDIWVLEKLDGKTIELNEGQKRPLIEINVNKMQVSGTDGCNSISGGIESISENNIVFGPLRSTRKMCINMDIPNAFGSHLSKVKTFKKENTNLLFFDKEGMEILSFKKID